MIFAVFLLPLVSCGVELCHAMNEVCRAGVCVSNAACRAPLVKLEGKSIYRRYKVNAFYIMGSSTYDLVVEYEYKLSSECGNRVHVTRNESITTYGAVSGAGAEYTACKAQTHVDNSLTITNNEGNTWVIFMKNMLFPKDKLLFGEENERLVVTNFDFDKGSKTEVQDIKYTWTWFHDYNKDPRPNLISCELRLDSLD